MTLTMFTLNAFYGLALAMNMFIIASGLNLIFGVLRVINFAHGMFYMFGAYITFTVAKTWGAPFAPTGHCPLAPVAPPPPSCDPLLPPEMCIPPTAPPKPDKSKPPKP